MKIQDLAKLAGVSPATVSRVFNHHPNISDDVRQRVMELARQHDYRPRGAQKPRHVVIILPDHEIYPIRNCLEMAMTAVVRELPRRGFRIEVLPQGNLDRLGSLPCCGAVAIGADPGDFAGWSRRFPCPLVLVDRAVPAGEAKVHSVRSDEAQGMALAIGHLRSRGCTAIGCIIHGAAGTGNVDNRRAAIRQALAANGYPADDALVRLCQDEDYVEAIGSQLKLGVDALFCPGGNAGIIAAFALALFNRRVPEDVSLVASENMQYSRLATPPQTTIAQDHLGLAGAIADIVESHLAGVVPAAERILPYHLTVRASVRAAKTG
ncbi:MAG: LacI family transcriptional regulator [Planctomycetes bacterium]|nr:LacI family transcriptional regulator [Planctomycetota bacterium]